MTDAPVDTRLRSLIADCFGLPPEAGVTRMRALLSDGARGPRGAAGATGAGGADQATMSAAALVTIKAGFPREGRDPVSFATLCRLHGRVDLLQAAFEMPPPAGSELCPGTANWLNQFCWAQHLDRKLYRSIVNDAVIVNAPQSIEFLALALKVGSFKDDERYLSSVYPHAGPLFTAARMKAHIDHNTPPPGMPGQCAVPAPERRRAMV